MPGRLRVVFVALEWPSSGPAGGVGRYVERLAREIRGSVELSVVAAEGARPMPDVEMATVSAPPRSGRFGRYYLMPLAVRRAVRSLEPDVIHSHGDDFGLRGESNIPIVRTYYGSSWQEARRGGGRPLRRLNHVLLAGLERSMRWRYSQVAAIGPDSVTAGRASHLIPPVFGMPTVAEVTRDEHRVAFIGAFSSKKRGDLALATITAARKVVPEISFVVIGPESDRPCYPEWVEFHSGISDAELGRLMSECGLLLAPSSYEGFGIPIWEALQAGTIVLTTPSPGARYVSRGAACCRIVAPEGLKRTLVELLRLGADEQAELRSLAVERAQQLAREGDPRRYVYLYQRAFSLGARG